MENKKSIKKDNKEINTFFFTQSVIVMVAILTLLIIRLVSKSSFKDISNEYKKYFDEDIPLSAISNSVEEYFTKPNAEDTNKENPKNSESTTEEKSSDEDTKSKDPETEETDEEINDEIDDEIPTKPTKKDSIKAVSTSNDNLVLTKLNEMQIPVMGRISSGFGYRVSPITGVYCLHDGMDIAAPMGTDILAAMDGTVIASVEDPEIGNYIKIDHGNGIVTAYGHCSKLIAKEGDKVKKGDLVAKVGSTGHSTGPHTHFEIRVNGVKVNPAYYLNVSEISGT